MKVGDKVLVDIDFANGGYKVTILEIYGKFAKVQNSNGETWDLMTNKLSPIKD